MQKSRNNTKAHDTIRRLNELIRLQQGTITQQRQVIGTQQSIISRTKSEIEAISLLNKIAVPLARELYQWSPGHWETLAVQKPETLLAKLLSVCGWIRDTEPAANEEAA